jgi:hypothetical protein
MFLLLPKQMARLWLQMIYTMCLKSPGEFQGQKYLFSKQLLILVYTVCHTTPFLLRLLIHNFLQSKYEGFQI